MENNSIVVLPLVIVIIVAILSLGTLWKSSKDPQEQHGNTSVKKKGWWVLAIIWIVIFVLWAWAWARSNYFNNGTDNFARVNTLYVVSMFLLLGWAFLGLSDRNPAASLLFTVLLAIVLYMILSYSADDSITFIFVLVIFLWIIIKVLLSYNSAKYLSQHHHHHNNQHLEHSYQ